MTKNVATHSRYGARNVWCPRYSQCLDKCLVNDEPGFTCQGCQYEHDLSGGPKDAGELAEDARGCMALLISIFRRVKIQDALNRVAL